jgi:hypothetical protein
LIEEIRPMKMKCTLKKCGKNTSENVQTKNSKVEENGEQIMKKNLQKLHV